MGSTTVGGVVLIRFPFSDLSQTKLRPALVLADASRGDWVLCQITSKPYADRRIVELLRDDFADGSLPLTSYARPAKLFTANQSLWDRQVGVLTRNSFDRVVDAVIQLLRPDSSAQ